MITLQTTASQLCLGKKIQRWDRCIKQVVITKVWPLWRVIYISSCRLSVLWFLVMCFADRADLHCRDQLLQVDKLPYWFLQPSASPTNSIYQRPQFSGLGLFIYGNNEPERIISCWTCKSMDLSHLGGIDMSQRLYVKPPPNCFFFFARRPKICLWCCAPECIFFNYWY